MSADGLHQAYLDNNYAIVSSYGANGCVYNVDLGVKPSGQVCCIDGAH